MHNRFYLIVRLLIFGSESSTDSTLNFASLSMTFRDSSMVSPPQKWLKIVGLQSILQEFSGGLQDWQFT
jgi:hypothetical protein